ncbi:hypothetical protein F2P81_005422 [Scophthalmus maximus]|uniref:Uncharacterized protein n=1 Tax=Scophthalmus maximus TaxID=52904 RepID=A0A6A4TDK1_SCOMX|nr:hypothetical protein F2P81_005422 [Scophthalmus maximus]
MCQPSADTCRINPSIGVTRSSFAVFIRMCSICEQTSTYTDRPVHQKTGARYASCAIPGQSSNFSTENNRKVCDVWTVDSLWRACASTGE